MIIQVLAKKQKIKIKPHKAVAELNYQPNANAQALASHAVDTIGVVANRCNADPFLLF